MVKRKSNALGKHWKLSAENKINIGRASSLRYKENPSYNSTHGMSYTRLYAIWHGMKSRCDNPKKRDVITYNGIKYDESWKKFENFRKDMGSSYRENLQIDRVNSSLGYFKENCRWVTAKENQNNKKNNVALEFKGITDSMNNWASFFGFNINTLRARIRKGWSTEKSLTVGNPYYA